MKEVDAIIFFAVVFVLGISTLGFNMYKLEIKKQAYYDCLEHNKQIAEKTGRTTHNMCYMF